MKNFGTKLFAAYIAIAVAAVTASLGCSMFKPEASSSPVFADGVHIVYRTKTDRLQVAGSAFRIAPSSGRGLHLPPLSIATLVIEYPHPQQFSEMARATLTVQAATGGDSLIPESSIGPQVPGEILTIDVPALQVKSIVAGLDDANFFRRAKVLDAEAFLAVRTEHQQLGKPYRAVAELDALMLRIAIAAPTATARASRPELARLPATDKR